MPAIDRDKYFAQIEYIPHSKGQIEYHASKARFRIACCGRRYGKSTMAGRDVQPQLFVPDRRFWIVGPTYDLGEKEFRVIWNDLIVKMKLGRDKRIKRAFNLRTGEMYIEFPWRTKIEVRSAQHPEHLVGEALHGVIMSEAAKHSQETWERFIRPSLADYRGWATFPSTPEGQNWFYDLYQFGQDPNLADYASWRFPSWENPIVYPGGRMDDEILLIEETTSPEWFAQEIGADFTAFVGRIYGEFDVETHVIDDYKFHPEWPNYGCFDWGFTNPLCFLEFQVDPWDNVYVWREHYLSYKRLQEHLDMLSAREQPDGYHLDLCFGDAADPEAAAHVSVEFCPCVADPLSKVNWREGIDLVKTFLKLRDTGEVEYEFGTPRLLPMLFVVRGCRNTVWEFLNYRARDNINANSNESGKASMADPKIQDHAMDTVRYFLMHRFGLGAWDQHL